MTANEWERIADLLVELWPNWKPTAAQRNEFRWVLARRRADTVTAAIRSHYADDDPAWAPALNRIAEFCGVVASQPKPVNESPIDRRMMRESDADDAIALECLRTWDDDRMAKAFALCDAVSALPNPPKGPPERWSKMQRGLMVAADWQLTNRREWCDRVIASAAERRQA